MAQLRVKATLDKSQYDVGLDAMKQSGKALNESLISLGGLGGMVAGIFGGAAILEGLKTFVSYMREASKEMADFSEQAENIGVDQQFLNAQIHGFENVGAKGETLIGIYGRMKQAQDGLISNDPKMVAAFEKLGIKREEAAGMTQQELMQKVLSGYNRAGGTGEAELAAKDILGKQIRDPATRRALLNLGGEGFNPSQQGQNTYTQVAAQMMDEESRKSTRAFKELMGQFWTEISPSAPGRDKVLAQMEKNKKEQEEQVVRNIKAMEDSDKKARDKKNAIAEEDKRYASDIEKERAEEIRKGIRLDRPDADSFQRRGMLAGGEVDSMAYALGRQQISIQEQLLESSRKIEAHMAIQARHREAMKTIKAKDSGAGTEQEEGVK